MFCPLNENGPRSPQSCDSRRLCPEVCADSSEVPGRGLDQLARAEKCVFFTFQQLHEVGSLHTTSSGARAALYVAFPARLRKDPSHLPHLPVLPQGHGNEAPAAPTTCAAGGWLQVAYLVFLVGVGNVGAALMCAAGRWDKEENPNDGLFIDLY